MYFSFMCVFVFVISFIIRMYYFKTPFYWDQTYIAYDASQLVRGKVLCKDIRVGLPAAFLYLYTFVQKYIGKEHKHIVFLTAFIISVGMVLLFISVFSLFGFFAAFSSVLFANLYSVNPYIEAIALPAESFTFTPLMGALSCVIWSLNTGYLFPIFFAGIFTGLAFLFKQTAILFSLVFIICMLFLDEYIFSLFIFTLGGLSAFVPLIIYCKRHKILKDYFNQGFLWQISGAFGKATKHQYQSKKIQKSRSKVYMLKMAFEKSSPFYPVLFLSMYAFVQPMFWKEYYWGVALVASFMMSVISINLKGLYSPHYWVNIIPWVSILAGAGLSFLVSNIASGVSYSYITMIFLFFLIVKFCRNNLPYYASVTKAISLKYDSNRAKHWRIHKEVASYIQKDSVQSDSILILGQGSLILYYSERDCFIDTPIIIWPAGIAWDSFVEKSQKSFPKYIICDTIYIPQIRCIDLSHCETHLNVAYSFDRNMEGVFIYKYNKNLTELRLQSILANSIDSSNRLDYLWIESYKKTENIFFNRHGTHTPDKCRVWIYIPLMKELSKHIILFMELVRLGKDIDTDRNNAKEIYIKIIDQIEKGGLLEYFSRIDDDKMIYELYAFIGVMREYVDMDIYNIYQEIADYLEVYLCNRNIYNKIIPNHIRHVLAGAYFHLGRMSKEKGAFSQAERFFKSCILHNFDHISAREHLNEMVLTDR